MEWFFREQKEKIASISVDLSAETEVNWCPALGTVLANDEIIRQTATTFMTGPAIDFINKVFKNDKGESVAEEIVNYSKYKILFSFGNPDRGKKMLKIANSLSKKQQDNSIVTALHLGSSDQIYAFDPDYEQKQFLPIVEESKMLHQKVSALIKVSIDIDV
ncbi:hypothetical protein FQR65_LT19974 [Abscondita terminalis]|nr:hypothetical protein FQR65_LT19974 [Abscondita terminalis]